MTDLMVRLALPVLVVARSRLGTINHTLLTLEALAARALAVAGVVMVGRQNLENRRAIETYGGVRSDRRTAAARSADAPRARTLGGV